MPGYGHPPAKRERQRRCRKMSSTIYQIVFNYFLIPLILYPANRGYIFAVGAGVRKVASADNRSIFYRASVKFVTRFASKINRQVCRQMARVSRE